jgi:hypothetical protein
MPSSVKCSVRPVAIKVLKSIGPTRSVCTVLSVSWREKRLGCPVSSSRMRPKVAEASWLLAVPGGPVSSACSRQSSASCSWRSTSSRSTKSSPSSSKKAAKRAAAAR